tara:strand:- start:275 stop:481 length:207 start_codon:yes stop_codon:yes gene_type:complete
MDLGMLTSWTTTRWGEVVVAVSILGLGLAHWGRFSDWMNWSVPVVGSVGNVAGAVGVLIGLTMILDEM